MTDYPLNTLPDDEWETCVGAGRMMAETMDAHRFDLGDLALAVEKRYGTDALGKYCADIGMARVQTLREYRRVAARFSRDIRMEFLQALSWSHFQAACVAGDDAELWLARAADDGLTVAALARAIKEATGKPVPPRKLYDGPGVVWQYANESRPYLVLEGDVSALAAGLKVTVRVWEASADA